MDLIHLANRVVEEYRSYLLSTFRFKDPQLRASFERALEEGHLAKGPFLEATPTFRRACKTADLLRELLGASADESLMRALHGERLLYKHQEQAIRNVVSERNVLVATGTGSGKTEAFLYPVLLDLYREHAKGTLGAGVRALILYPMNALANDQRERLGEIARRLEIEGCAFRFTFGQYTGQTPENRNDSRRRAAEQLSNRLPGELVLREEMQRTPPHILLTNYSMLEYLLLRPADSPLFDNGRAQWWKFLILDEAHQYRGSRGIEMAMLLRRLKRRLREGGRTGSFRCIATSATLLGGAADRAQAATFAAALFGEPFQPESIILAETEEPSEDGTHRLSCRHYGELREIINSSSPEAEARLANFISSFGLPYDARDHGLAVRVGRILRSDRRAIELRRAISGRPVLVSELAARLFADAQPHDQVGCLSDLVDLLVRAHDPETAAPLLSARYHMFLRALEGVFVSYVPEKTVTLERRVEQGSAAVFEVALCRECGQHYFVDAGDPDQYREPIRDTNDPAFGVTFLRPVEDDATEEEGDDEVEKTTLCLMCGKKAPQEGATCGHEQRMTVVLERRSQDDEKADGIARCGACGYNAGGRDPVRELVHGTDGPHAVVATALHCNLPADRRKVLAFADGRQNAAYFAWYLSRSYEDIQQRRFILRALRDLTEHAPQGVSLKELSDQVRDLVQREQILPAAVGDIERTKRAWVWVFREFLTEEVRISLEGVGLARWEVKLPDGLRVPEFLNKPPWSLEEPEARALICALLDSMRRDGAVEMRATPGVVVTWDDLDLQRRQKKVVPSENARVRSDEVTWLGQRGKRFKLLQKILQIVMDKEEARRCAIESLRELWDTLEQSDRNARPEDRLLIRIGDGRRLNPDWWRVRAVPAHEPLFRCRICGRLQSLSIRSRCLRHQCPGTVDPVDAAQERPDHYRNLYESAMPSSLRAEEHTAQLDYEKAREFQHEFKQGRIHLLSCSTTFELGVDLGDLDVIFLRNVPPEAFNYAQRVGRSGRRVGHPGLAVTFCRRNPHDLYHFARPEQIMAGVTRPPMLTLRNEKILTRHMVAVALSAYFRHNPARFANVKAFLGDLRAPDAVEEIRTYLDASRAHLERAYDEIIPSSMRGLLGLDDGSWVDKIAASDTRLGDAVAEVSSDYRQLENRKDELVRNNQTGVDRITRRMRTIETEDVLSFLSRKAVIPKYGFPVDVVELDTAWAGSTEEGGQISLQRDLTIAISEFAPTSQLIANKKLWSSRGLKKVPEKEWQRGRYLRCKEHNLFVDLRLGNRYANVCCKRAVEFNYVIPRFGFEADPRGPVEPSSRPPRLFSTRPYFAGFAGAPGQAPGAIPMPADPPLVTVKRACPGRMFVVCEGRREKGFYLCSTCGAGFRDRPRERDHSTSLGGRCSGTLENVALAHEFVTDVLEVQFHHRLQGESDPWLSYSLAQALVEGAADVLEVPSTDLSATVMNRLDPYCPAPIVLYDNVPGGAGLVGRLEDRSEFRRCLLSARDRVSGACRCAEATSCYGCLRNFSNQFLHRHLQRGPVLKYLEALLSSWTSI